MATLNTTFSHSCQRKFLLSISSKELSCFRGSEHKLYGRHLRLFGWDTVLWLFLLSETFFFFIFHTSWIISVLEQNSPNLFLTPIWYHREWSDPDHIHNLHADHCPSRRLSASVRDFGRLVFLNAYPCRPPRGSLSPEPPMNHGITIADSGTRIQHVGFWGWGGGEGRWRRGWLEWIMYIITCLSPEHLAKSLKHCSNHNNQSSCFFPLLCAS